MITTKMAFSRRHTLYSLIAAAVASSTIKAQEQDQPFPTIPKPKEPDEEPRLPNGKSQRDEMARQQHADALKDADALVAAAETLRDELKRAGEYVVPVNSVRKTEEIEKLAKRIRGRLKN